MKMVVLCSLIKERPTLLVRSQNSLSLSQQTTSTSRSTRSRKIKKLIPTHLSLFLVPVLSTCFLFKVPVLSTVGFWGSTKGLGYQEIPVYQGDFLQEPSLVTPAQISVLTLVSPNFSVLKTGT
jgi:hypothetical protein